MNNHQMSQSAVDVKKLQQRVEELERIVIGAFGYSLDSVQQITTPPSKPASNSKPADQSSSSSASSPTIEQLVASLPKYSLPSIPAFSMTVLGCGPSTGVPRIPCLLESPIKCSVCRDAVLPHSKNHRRNPALLIHFKSFNILIDCGKTFREGMVAAAIHHQVAKIDAVIITHAHADACYGYNYSLDDLREWTEETKIPVYVCDRDFPAIQSVFPYLVDTKKATGSGYVSQLDFVRFSDSAPFTVHGLTFYPFNVEHGPNNYSLAFRFGSVLYISDVSKISPAERAQMMAQPTEILFIDCLLPDRDHVSHLGLPGALAEIRLIKPKRAFLLGLSHCFEYHHTMATLYKLRSTEGLYIEPCYDGLVLHLPEQF